MQVSFQCQTFENLGLQKLYELLALRQEVFIIEQKCCYVDADGLDPIALHLYAQDSQFNYLAYARLLPPGAAYEQYASFGRVLVPIPFRSKGYGIALVKACITHCHIHFGKVPIQIGAQLYLQDFYRSFGFSSVSGVYQDAGIAHVKMRLAHSLRFDQ